MKTWLHALQQQISRQIRENKLPHALLLSGVRDAGHKDIAHWLIQVLLCQTPTEQVRNEDLAIIVPCENCKTCKLFASDSYPDHLTIVNDKNTIGVDLIRKLSQFFERTAHIGQAKTAWVNHADTMTVSAANALLKTLEEPTADSFIILTTNRNDMLLPTIISRCQKIEIRPPVGEKLLAEFDHQAGDVFTNLSHLSDLTDSSAVVAFTEFRDKVEHYLSARQYRAEVLANLVDSRDGFRWLEKIVVDLMRNQWGWQTVQDQQEQSCAINKQQLWQVYNLIQAANVKLKTLVQVNRQFLSEKLLADISVVVHNNKQKVEG
jgi:DNA polymerase III subunit delta'